MGEVQLTRLVGRHEQFPAGDQYIVFKQNTRSTDFEGFDLSKTRVGGSDYFRFLVASASGQGAQSPFQQHHQHRRMVSRGGGAGLNFLQLYVNGSFAAADQRDVRAELRHAATLLWALGPTRVGS